MIMGHSKTEVDFQVTGKILDVGPGHNPFPHATDCLEPYPNTLHGGKGEPVRFLPKAQYVFSPIDGKPTNYPDKYFNFVYCNHVFEHLISVERAVKEINRIGLAGYIEVPSFLVEIMMPSSTHKNIFWKENGKVYYQPKSEIPWPKWKYWAKSYTEAHDSSIILKEKAFCYVILCWNKSFIIEKKPFPMDLI